VARSLVCLDNKSKAAQFESICSILAKQKGASRRYSSTIEKKAVPLCAIHTINAFHATSEIGIVRRIKHFAEAQLRRYFVVDKSPRPCRDILILLKGFLLITVIHDMPNTSIQQALLLFFSRCLRGAISRLLMSSASPAQHYPADSSVLLPKGLKRCFQIARSMLCGGLALQRQ